MVNRVIYTSAADGDIAEAYNWFEDREPGLGEEFLRCVEACVLRIERNPNIYPIAADNFRRALVRRFPFEIFYDATDEQITIYSVFHCSQDPEKWRKRLGHGNS